MTYYEQHKEVINGTMQRVSRYLAAVKAETHVECYVKELVLKSLESNASIDYGMCAMHQALHSILPELTAEYHAERNVRVPIQRTSMASLPMDRSWSRYLKVPLASIKRVLRPRIKQRTEGLATYPSQS